MSVALLAGLAAGLVLIPGKLFPSEQACLGMMSWLDVSLQCYKLIPHVHIMPLLVDFAAEVLVPKDFIPTGFGELRLCL